MIRFQRQSATLALGNKNVDNDAGVLLCVQQCNNRLLILFPLALTVQAHHRVAVAPFSVRQNCGISRYFELEFVQEVMLEELSKMSECSY